MGDFEQGLKRDVAEIKFLIHDLRVEKFINEVIHFHVTLNTDLEIHNVSEAQILHEDDVHELKALAQAGRKSNQEYSNAVRSFSPERTILKAGRQYIQDIFEICELILDPMWGRGDRILSFLPEDARSVQSRNHYRNCIHWICGVYFRIQHFLDEAQDIGTYEDFDIAKDLSDFTGNVIRGYVVEKGGARIELQLGRLDPAVIGGNRHRFRRVFFNLVMNAVDAMSSQKVGILNISEELEGDRAILRVRDSGEGMTEDKIDKLLSHRESLDGELHSLGFVFVRQTVADLGGELAIESVVGQGTTISVSLPTLPGAVPEPRRRSRCEKYEIQRDEEPAPAPETKAQADDSGPVGKRPWGKLVLEAYRKSTAHHPGSIFAMTVTEENEVDFFTVKPYEKLWNITHEDLTPMFYQATVRGRLEDDDLKKPVLILKAPQVVGDYFEYKTVRETEWSADLFVAMVHNEYVRVARKLIESGLPSDMGVELTDMARFFPDATDMDDSGPFPLRLLANQPLEGKKEGK